MSWLSVIAPSVSEDSVSEWLAWKGSQEKEVVEIVEGCEEEAV